MCSPKDEVAWQNGKQFYFWQEYKQHPDFVEAKYKDDGLKEEILHSEALYGLFSAEQWKVLSRKVTDILNYPMKSVRILSSGRKENVYQIKEGLPLDEQHLLALKLWTDSENLQRTLYRILREGHRVEVSQIANWARLLTETVQCYGSPVSYNTAFWITVDREYYFPSIEFVLHLPMMLRTTVM